ncbi:MAG TPA: hypothetical protein VK140_16750 [Ktedonobacteraceae bacterium]|jgi:hypothetical protein|nr:hypothetical protein [Ktedonobacteraceae bacterium]
MKNPMVYYAAIGLGIIALAIGGYLLATATAAAPHHTSSYAALGVGVVLLIGGVVGWFVMKPSASAK